MIDSKELIETIKNDLFLTLIDFNFLLVWLYASLSIFGVSLCGLLGVAVIPCMEKHYYNHVLQFFVSLAVGTLCGDALLHLLPHVSLSSLFVWIRL